MKKLLKIKHWQLFLLMVGIPMIIMMGLMFIIISNKGGGIWFLLYILASILSVVILFSWFWAIGNELYPRIPKGSKFNFKKFKFFLLFPCFYIGVISVFVLTQLSAIAVFLASTISVLILLILHLFAMFCIFYTMYSAAKLINMVEKQRAVTFSEFAGDFFLIWFFFVGIWIIQPRLNKIMNDDWEYGIEEHLVED